MTDYNENTEWFKGIEKLKIVTSRHSGLIYADYQGKVFNGNFDYKKWPNYIFIEINENNKHLLCDFIKSLYSGETELKDKSLIECDPKDSDMFDKGINDLNRELKEHKLDIVYAEDIKECEQIINSCKNNPIYNNENFGYINAKLNIDLENILELKFYKSQLEDIALLFKDIIYYYLLISQKNLIKNEFTKLQIDVAFNNNKEEKNKIKEKIKKLIDYDLDLSDLINYNEKKFIPKYKNNKYYKGIIEIVKLINKINEDIE